MNVAVVGYGYWGPNLVRNFSWNENCVVKYVCDLSEDRLKKVRPMFPNVENITTNFDDVLNDSSVTAVAIATPVNTHYILAKKALEAGKHVLLEKPMTDKSSDAKELIEIAKKNNLVLMVDHTFLFTGAVKKIKELITSGQIGDVYYFDSVRVNLGLFQSDVNVIWDLAPHDLSIMFYAIDKKPVSVTATGVSHTGSDIENLAYVSVFYEDSTMAHFHVNWLSPIKVRQIMIAGSEKMIVYDDMETVEKIKVYDSGIHVASKEKMYETMIQYRTGDMWAPKLDGTEALKDEIIHFIDCIEKNEKPITDGQFGLDVVQVLEAAQLSIKQNGKQVFIKDL